MYFCLSNDTIVQVVAKFGKSQCFLTLSNLQALDIPYPNPNRSTSHLQSFPKAFGPQSFLN